MFRRLMMVLMVLSVTTFSFANEEDKVIHQELRELLSGIEKVVNAEEYDNLAQYFHKDMRVTMSNQEVLSSHSDIKKFFNFWFGELTSDSFTELYANKTMGIVRGDGEENTYLSDSRFFPIKTRWTATVIKDTDGKWRILSLHLGVNFLDNPILSVAENSGKYFAVGGGLIGLLVGIILGVLISRRRKLSTVA